MFILSFFPVAFCVIFYAKFDIILYNLTLSNQFSPYFLVFTKHEPKCRNYPKWFFFLISVNIDSFEMKSAGHAKPDWYKRYSLSETLSYICLRVNIQRFMFLFDNISYCFGLFFSICLRRLQ